MSHDDPTVTPLPVPAPSHVDAPRRAWRTLVQGMLANALIYAIPAVQVGLGNIRWTRGWWIAFGASVGSVMVTSALSYVARFLVPPATQ